MTVETSKKDGLEWAFSLWYGKSGIRETVYGKQLTVLYLHNNIFTGELMNYLGMMLVCMTIKVYWNQHVLTLNVRAPNYSGPT